MGRVNFIIQNTGRNKPKFLPMDDKVFIRNEML
jgi:hypothetical protein